MSQCEQFNIYICLGLPNFTDVDVGTRMKRLTEKREKEKSKLRSDIDSVSASPNKKRRRSGKNSENEDRMKKPRHSSSRGGGQGTYFPSLVMLKASF